VKKSEVATRNEPRLAPKTGARTWGTRLLPATPPYRQTENHPCHNRVDENGECNLANICAPPWPGASHIVNASAGFSRPTTVLSILETFSCRGSIEKSTVNKMPFKAMAIRNAMAIRQSCWGGFIGSGGLPTFRRQYRTRSKRGCPISRIGREKWGTLRISVEVYWIGGD
jgi:hypothetical protein